MFTVSLGALVGLRSHPQHSLRRARRRAARPSAASRVARAVSYACESLEPRRLLSFSVSFPGGASLVQRADANASHLLGNQSENMVVINPTNPRNVVAVANDLATSGDKAWVS